MVFGQRRVSPPELTQEHMPGVFRVDCLASDRHIQSGPLQQTGDLSNELKRDSLSFLLHTQLGDAILFIGVLGIDCVSSFVSPDIW